MSSETSVDTNVIIGLLDDDDAFNVPAKRALQKAAARGALILCAPVYIELCAMPEREDFSLDAFLRKTRIEVDWTLDEAVWRKAGIANARHMARRRQSLKTMRRPGAGNEMASKRMAADFLIGAHALVRGAELLTFDKGVFSTYFPGVKVVEV